MGNILQGKQVLVTREQTDCQHVGELISKAGGIPLLCPLIETSCVQDVQMTHGEFDWLFFTSAKGVRGFATCLAGKVDVASVRIAAIGPKTAAALKRHGYRVDFIPTIYQADEMVAEFFEKYPAVGGVRQILGNLSLSIIETACRKRGIAYDSVVVYETRALVGAKATLHEIFTHKRLDYITVTSPSIARALSKMIEGHFKEKQIRRTPTICIGPTTAKAANKYGFFHTVYPAEYTIEAMIRLIGEEWGSEAR